MCSGKIKQRKEEKVLILAIEKGEVKMSDKVTFEITEEIQLLSETQTGTRKELNLVSWNGGEPKLEIRNWPADHSKALKGITLTDLEAKLLRDALNKLDL